MTPSQDRIPITFIAGPEGSGKSTLLRHLLAGLDHRTRVILNSRQGLGEHPGLTFARRDLIAPEGSCACCDGLQQLSTEVDAALANGSVDRIIVEMCARAEPDRVVLECFGRLPHIRVDAVLTVVGADTLILGPQNGEPLRVQIREADIIIVNKSELLAPDDVAPAERSLRRLNTDAPILFVRRGEVDPLLALGARPDHRTPGEIHPGHLRSFTFTSAVPLRWRPVETFIDTMDCGVVRIRGTLNIAERGTFSLSYVSGRWELDRCADGETRLVFIGDQLCSGAIEIVDRLRQCQVARPERDGQCLTEALRGEHADASTPAPAPDARGEQARGAARVAPS